MTVLHIAIVPTNGGVVTQVCGEGHSRQRERPEEKPASARPQQERDGTVNTMVAGQMNSGVGGAVGWAGHPSGAVTLSGGTQPATREPGPTPWPHSLPSFCFLPGVPFADTTCRQRARDLILWVLLQDTEQGAGDLEGRPEDVQGRPCSGAQLCLPGGRR